MHRWISTGEDTEDRCLGCGVVAPDHGQGVLMDHGPLPLGCPGPDVGNPHHYHGDRDHLVCARCGHTIGLDTVPDSVDWECPPE